MSTLADVLKLEIDFSSGPLAAPTYVDVTDDYTLGGSTSRGRDSIGPEDVFGTGNATIDRDNSSNSIPPTTWLRGKHVRIASRVMDIPIFTGYIDRVSHDQSAAPFRSAVSVSCVDNRFSRLRDTATNLLNALIAAGVGVPVQPPDAAGIIRAFNVPYHVDLVETFDLMGLSQALMANEIGFLAIQKDGSIAYNDRGWRLRQLADQYASPRAVFSDTPQADSAYPLLAASAGGVLVVSEPEEAYRDRVEFTGLSGVTKIAADVPADYDPTTFTQTTDCPNDNWTAANANFVLKPALSTDLFWRKFTVRIWPTPDDTIIDTICDIELGDIVEVLATPVGAGARVESVLFVESITHSFSASPQVWDVTFGCSDADAYFAAWGTNDDYLQYDDSQFYDNGLKFRP